MYSNNQLLIALLVVATLVAVGVIVFKKKHTKEGYFAREHNYASRQRSRTYDDYADTLAHTDDVQNKYDDRELSFIDPVVLKGDRNCVQAAVASGCGQKSKKGKYSACNSCGNDVVGDECNRYCDSRDD